MIKLLFVCLGNICRSPAAAAIMEQLLKDDHLSKQVVCDSAGLTTTFEGKSANTMMQDLAAERNITITSIARSINPFDFDHADFILGMTDEIVAELRFMAGDTLESNKIHNLCEFCQYHPDSEVPDPYLGDPEDFEFVLDLLEDACHGLLTMLKKQIN